MKFSNKLFLIFIIFLFNSNLSYASSINNINVVDEQNIEFDISRDVSLWQWELDAEIKIMKDINVSFVSKDFEDKNKLILNLWSEMSQNSLYSLITILWPEWNMDFITGLWLDNAEILNNQKIDIDKQWIKRLVIVNATTIELYFNNIIEEDELEFKLFNELDISKIDIVEANDINISLNDKMEKSSNYILMVLSMSDDNWSYISLNEDLYEIYTDKNLKTFVWDENMEEIIEKVEEDSIEDFALNSAETPDTGPETTVLIVLTFIFNTIFILRRKFIKK